MKQLAAPETGQSAQDLNPVFVFNTNSNSPHIVRKLLLQFKCGCRSTKKSAVYRRKRSKKGRAGYYCKKHNQFWEYKISYCKGCGTELKIWAGPGPAKAFCSECHTKKQRARTRQYNHIVSLLKNGARIVAAPKRNVMKQPDRVFSVSDSREKEVRCIPCDRLFRVHRKIVGQQSQPAA